MFYLVEDQGVTIDKDPNASHRYGLNVAKQLADGDVVNGVTATASGGVTASSPQVAGTVVSARVDGGTVGQVGKVTFRWTTQAGDTDDWTLFFNITER